MQKTIRLTSTAIFVLVLGIVSGCSGAGTSPAAPGNADTSTSGGSGGNGGSGGTSDSTTFTVGGTISNLFGSIVLQNLGANDLTLTSNGPFTFMTALTDTSTYSVSIKSQPLGQTCTISKEAGVINGANITNVSVNCSAMILFSSPRKLDGTDAANTNNVQNVWVMNTDGGGARPLTSMTAPMVIIKSHQSSPDVNKILYVSNRKLDGTAAVNNANTQSFYATNIWMLYSDGSGTKPLTSLTADYATSNFPQWSPDGTKIVYMSSRKLDGTDGAIVINPDSNTNCGNSFCTVSNIWVMNADGSGSKPLTSMTAPMSDSNAPQWSPDGTKIVYVSSRKLDGTDGAIVAAMSPSLNCGGKAWCVGSNIWVMNADGSGAKPLTSMTVTVGGDQPLNDSPQWSPDGTKIVYVSPRKFDGTDAINTTPYPNVWVMNADGSGGKPLTMSIGDCLDGDINPKWSPDGTKVMYVSHCKLDGTDTANTNNTSNVWVMNADGSGGKPLTSLMAQAKFSHLFGAQWSSDGAKIVYESSRKLDGTDAANTNNTSNIWVMNADGSGAKPLTLSTNDHAYCQEPQWVP